MPIYEYRCDNGHTFEVMQRMSDDPLIDCSQCGAPVQRVFHPVAIHFKGSGFYNTDYGKKKGGGNGSGSGEGAKESKGSESGSGSSDSKSSDSSSGSGDSKAAASTSSD
jgi:putative FmdB family regulatory protein